MFRFMGAGGATHPPWQDRVREAGRGWDLASGAGPGPGGDPGPGPGGNPGPGYDRPDDDRIPPPPPRIAAFCVTPAGHCRMGMRVPVGAPCVCYSGFGVFPGVGQ